MFFIGPSANIFIYLLVSAFFVICVYTKNEAKIPESLPGYVLAVNTRVHVSEVSHYHVARHVNSKEKTELAVGFNNDRSKSKTHAYFTGYDDPNLAVKTPRAPPVVLSFRTTS